MLFRLTNSWMNINRGDWCIMVLELAEHEVLIPEVALVDTEVFRANIEGLLLTFCKVQTMRTDWVSASITASLHRLCHGVSCSCWISDHPPRCVEDGEILRICEHLWLPSAHLAIITDTHDMMRVLVSNHIQGIDWILMTILCKATLLNRLRSVASISICIDRIFLSTYVPLKKIASHGRTNDNVWVVRIEDRLRDFILTVERQFWSSL